MSLYGLVTPYSRRHNLRSLRLIQPLRDYVIRALRYGAAVVRLGRTSADY